MAEMGTINVSVFNAARQPWTGPEVRLVLTDPFTSSSNKKLVDKTMKKGTNHIVLEGVPADAGQRYILFLDADKHRSHSVFPVKPALDAPTPLNIMLIPNDPVPNFASFNYNELQLRSPQFHSALSEGVVESDFLGLPKSDTKFGLFRMAAILNIEAKLRATALKQGEAVDFIRLIKNLDCCERDRIKVEVAADMPGNVKGLKTFNELNEDLNELNHKGFPVSYKEKVAFCSLQLSFAKKAQAGLLSADIDIDLLTDIGHFGEVIKNKITKLKTDPFTVYVLLFDQGIRPLYTLKA
ncbi:MAG: hypothetical protein QOH49_3435 [Acidobacteriota bacterium]|jgi:hypothetical protein|nr:hypothetical protein [Acidobacteriota bacterium]